MDAKALKKIEEKWQAKWDEKRAFWAESDPKRPKFFVNIPIPYINGSPHLGHTFTFGRADTYARFKRLQGFNVLFPQGFHATGEPIVGVQERLKNKDPIQIKAMRDFGATDQDIEAFKQHPKNIIEFFMNRWLADLANFGYSADWRRSFLTTKLNPPFSKFVEWQYRKLKEKGYVVQGTHPVIWCPKDKSPTGDHDRLVGEGESPQEHTIIKFRAENGDVLPCATLRPETIYGVTNLWVNPYGTYHRARVNEENWILSADAAKKMKEQQHHIEILETFVGQTLVGREAENPVTKDKIFVFPAEFVETSHATGVVMSVPAHAPYDYIGLQEIKKYSALAKDLQPIKIIDTQGFGAVPAKDALDQAGAKDPTQKDAIEQATNNLYKKEFNQGIFSKNAKEFTGKKISEAKDKITQNLRDNGYADVIFEPTNRVVCRCGTENFVKILENQWFIKYSDPQWKEKTKNFVMKMKFYPEEARNQVLNTIDWLKDKACARKSGLGTPLPWDSDWIVETLSDSTIYMAYYTIAKIITQKKIPPTALRDDVFDYVFLGKPLKGKAPMERKIIEEMRKEFLYWYPSDMRISAKDLLQNHLTFFIFQHVALFGEKLSPRGVAVNGYTNLEGQKMSKSKGNFITLQKVLEDFGADLVRANIVTSAESIDDADWRGENIPSFLTRLNAIAEEIKHVKKYTKTKIEQPDEWLISRMHKHIMDSEKAYEELRFRSASQELFFHALNDLKWYLKRTKANPKVVKDYIRALIIMISPIVPHYAEEMWEKSGGRGLVAQQPYPKTDRKMIRKDVESVEDYIRRVIGDINEIKKIAKMEQPQKITLFTSPSWKYDVYRSVLKEQEAARKNPKMKFNPGALIKDLIKNKKFANVQKDLPNFIMRLAKSQLSADVMGTQKEFEILNSASEFLTKEMGANVEVHQSDQSTHAKARSADVMKPGILVE